MVDIKTLLPELRKLVTELSEDLLKRVGDNAEINSGLKEAYEQIEKGGRTAQAYEVWLEDYLDQVAVAWVLSCVFVRFMEDNDLIDETWLAGEGGRRQRAEDSHTLYFREHPKESDREYFEHVFQEVGKIPAATDLFAEGKTPLWAVGPTGDACRSLLKFWQETDADSGKLLRTFDVEEGDTRFLGDLYQELSERAKKKYALLQTPVFVEEFILDRTLTPAINEFGFETVRMIDPTCGSGHFLLGAFERLFNLWSKPEHTSGNAETDAQKALDGVWGVDINPFAVAIARFRLIVAAVQACGVRSLKKAPGWKTHLATGDSLLFGNRFCGRAQQKLLTAGDDNDQDSAREFWAPDVYACEDKESVTHVLGQQYHAVVGNPPYITQRDPKLNAAYRDRYSSCHKRYSLSAPFLERFFDLCLNDNDSVGFVGQITTNSFTKRGFGEKLIQDFLPTVDLTHVIDTAGAFIPGHATATVILFGRNRPPSSSSVRAVMGIRGEPSTPIDPAKGAVWQSIVQYVDQSGAENEFVSVTDISRQELSVHPWSLAGGGASELFKQLNQFGSFTIKDVCPSIGYACFPGLDPPFVVDRGTLQRRRIQQDFIKPYIVGETIRDWGVSSDETALVPYDSDFELLPYDDSQSWARLLWPYRSSLKTLKTFGNKTRGETGEAWWSWYRWIPKKVNRQLSIVYAKIATHFHGTLDRGGKTFNGSVFVVNLDDDASEASYQALLGIMNSSLACFWMKQVFHPQGTTNADVSLDKGRPESNRYQLAATGMKSLPLVTKEVEELSTILTISQKLGHLVERLEECSPQSVLLAWVQSRGATELADDFQLSSSRHVEVSKRMKALQEELDWEIYRLYGLQSNGADLELVRDDSFVIDEWMRPFRWDSDGTPEVHEEDLPKVYRDRRSTIESDANIKCIETLVFKRPWWGKQGVYGGATKTYSEQAHYVCKQYLLGHLDTPEFWEAVGGLRLTSVAELSSKLNVQTSWQEVASVYLGRSDFDTTSLLSELISSSSVPLLNVFAYKDSGLRKRRVWEEVWGRQRREDEGCPEGQIKAPPYFKSGDFQESSYWSLRGKMDVPQEQFILFPHCERDGDPSVVVGWAGWDHLQQATAIVAYYDARKREGWTAARLTPLLAGLDQLLPWIHQWHPEIDPEYNETAGTSFQTLLESEAQELGLTLEDIRNWTPPKKIAKRKMSTTASARAKEGA